MSRHVTSDDDDGTASGTDIIFEEPARVWRSGQPTERARITDWCDELRAHPDRWARYPTPVLSTVATFIKRGQYTGITAGDFEATTRTAADTHRRWLFVRYVGGRRDRT